MLNVYQGVTISQNGTKGSKKRNFIIMKAGLKNYLNIRFTLELITKNEISLSIFLIR